MVLKWRKKQILHNSSFRTEVPTFAGLFQDNHSLCHREKRKHVLQVPCQKVLSLCILLHTPVIKTTQFLHHYSSVILNYFDNVRSTTNSLQELAKGSGSPKRQHKATSQAPVLACIGSGVRLGFV